MRVAPFSTTPAEVVDKIIEAVRGGMNLTQAAKAVGVSDRNVKTQVAKYRPEHGPNSLPETPRGSAYSKAKIGQIELLICEGLRPKQIAVRVGISSTGLNVWLRSRLEELLARGAQCACGKPFAHQGSCVGENADRRGVAFGDGRNPYRADTPEVARLREMAESGASVPEISRASGVSMNMARYYVRPTLLALRQTGRRCACGKPVYHNGRCQLPEHVRAERLAAKRRVRSTAVYYPPNVAARTRDPLFAKISDLVPRWLSADLRDDVIADAYLAMLEAA